MAQLTTLIEPTERELTAQVLTLAHLQNWLVVHFRPALRADGSWRTPLQGDGAGFPDLVLVRGGRLIFAELKAQHGRLAPLQRRWIEALTETRMEIYVWKPSDWPQIVEVLT